jgi:hemoglobin
MSAVLPTPSLLVQLGGRESIEAVVAIFYGRVLADPRLAHFFRGVQMSRLQAHQIDFFCAVLGGADFYRGKNMVAAHAGLDISDADFDAVAGHLATTLEQVGVPEALRARVIGLVAPLRSQIVTRRVSASGVAGHRG